MKRTIRLTETNEYPERIREARHPVFSRIISMLLLVALISVVAFEVYVLMAEPTPPQSDQLAAAPAVSILAVTAPTMPASPSQNIAATAPEALAITATMLPSPIPPTATQPSTQPSLTRLTEPGCCINPFWSVDSQTILFIDKPAADAPTGIYGIPITGGMPQLITEQVGIISPDGRYRAYLDDQGQTIVESSDALARWIIPNEGLFVVFSPQSQRVAWADMPLEGNFDQREAAISISSIVGSDSQLVATVYGGGIAGWLDDQTLLLFGKDEPTSPDMSLFSLNVVDGTRTDLFTNQRMLPLEIAPGGAWILVQVSLDPDSPDEDGLCMISRDGSQRVKVPVLGGAHWRDASHLLVIPMELSSTGYHVLQVDAASGEITALTDPAVMPFRIQAGDWSVSPDGNHIALFGSDNAIWMISLPPNGE